MSMIRGHREPGRSRDQRGQVAVEFVILVPALLLMVALVVAGARWWTLRAATAEAATAAARAATVQRDATSARRVVEIIGGAGLDSCRSVSIRSDLGAFSAPAGSAGEVRVTVSCEVELADLLLPGAPGSLTTQSTGTSVLDRYRGR